MYMTSKERNMRKIKSFATAIIAVLLLMGVTACNSTPITEEEATEALYEGYQSTTKLDVCTVEMELIQTQLLNKITTKMESKLVEKRLFTDKNSFYYTYDEDKLSKTGEFAEIRKETRGYQNGYMYNLMEDGESKSGIKEEMTAATFIGKYGDTLDESYDFFNLFSSIQIKTASKNGNIITIKGKINEGGDIIKVHKNIASFTIKNELLASFRIETKVDFIYGDTVSRIMTFKVSQKTPSFDWDFIMQNTFQEI